MIYQIFKHWPRIKISLSQVSQVARITSMNHRNLAEDDISNIQTYNERTEEKVQAAHYWLLCNFFLFLLKLTDSLIKTL
jgi:hypothetical protein